MSYNVAFVGTRKAGGFEGVVTWSSFQSKEVFDEFYAKLPEEKREKQRIVEEGVSVERCVELVRQTPAACYFAAALQSATGPNGEIDERHLEHEILLATFAASQGN